MEVGESHGTPDAERMQMDISRCGDDTVSGQVERKPRAAFGQMCYLDFHPKSNRTQGESWQLIQVAGRESRPRSEHTLTSKVDARSRGVCGDPTCEHWKLLKTPVYSERTFRFTDITGPGVKAAEVPGCALSV